MLTNRNKVPDPVRLPLCLGLWNFWSIEQTSQTKNTHGPYPKSWDSASPLISTDINRLKKIGENSTDISPVTQHANNQKGWSNTFWCRSKPSIFLGVWQSPSWWCPAQGSSVSTLRASNPLMDCRPLPPAVETQAVWNLCLNISCIVSGGHSFILLLQ